MFCRYENDPEENIAVQIRIFGRSLRSSAVFEAVLSSDLFSHDLSGDRLRERIHEFDDSRILVRRRCFFDVVLDVFDQFGRADISLSQNDRCFHDFAADRIGDGQDIDMSYDEDGTGDGDAEENAGGGDSGADE